MRDRIRERFQFAVGGFKLLRSLLHAALQVSVELKNFFLCPLALGDVTLNGHVMRQLALHVGNRNRFYFNPIGHATLVVFEQFRACRFTMRKGCEDALYFMALGVRAVENAGRLSCHFVLAVARLPFKCSVDKHDFQP